MKQRNKNNIFSISCIILIFLYIMILHTQVNAADKIRVGYYNNNFHYQKEDGTYAGYGYEYLQEIAKYTGWDYEYISGTLTECHERLKKGEIDILGAVQYTKERTDYLNYPKLSSGVSYAMICIAQDNDTIAYNDFKALKGKTVGLLEGSNNNQYFDEFCSKKKIHMKPVVYQTQKELNVSLADGTVDCILTNSIRREENQKVIAQFSPIEYFFAVPKRERQILAHLNEAQEQIKIINPNYDSILYEKYYGNESSSSFVMTKAEQDYVKTTQPIRVVLQNNLSPFQASDDSSGFKGITTDVLQLISKMTGLKFEIIAASNHQDVVHKLEEGSAQMAGCILEDNSRAEKQDWILSSGYLNSNWVLAKNKSAKKIKILAASKDGYSPVFGEFDKIMYYGSLRECIEAVNKQKADACYGNSYMAEQIVEDPLISHVALSTSSLLDSNVCFAFKKPADTKLVSLFNKALSCISDQEIQKFVYQNTLQEEYQMSLKALLYNRPDYVTGCIIFIFLIIIILVIYILGMKVHNQKILTKTARLEEERYRVATEIANDILFEYDISKDCMIFAEKFRNEFGREPIINGFVKSNAEKENVKQEDIPIYLEFCNALLSGNEMVESEFRMLNRMNEYVWCHLRGKTVFSSQRHPVKIIGKISNIDLQKRELESLLFKSQRDSLTSVYNKEVTKDLVEEYLYQSNRESRHALMIIDIDKFKQINDTYGHPTGDSVLCMMVNRIKTMFRNDDIIGRVGGDEFVVFMHNVKTMEKVEERAGKLNLILQEKEMIEGNNIFVTASIGIAMYPKDGRTYDELIKSADEALYEVKEHGRNGFFFYKNQE